MSGLRVENLRVELDGRTIIDDLSLQVDAGELLVVAGPSGSGKSTLLRTLAGLLPATHGRIELDGRDIGDLPPGQRDIAMMFQSDTLYPHLSVLENLCFGLRARGASRTDARMRAREIATRLGIAELLERPPHALSGGQRQRVALGRALLRQPRLFLMDEPLSSLDAPLRVRARAELMQLHRSLRSATLFVTHDQVEAMALADRLAIIEHGRLLQVGTPRDVYARPDSLAVARFLGAPAINLLDLARGAGHWHWRELALPLDAPAPRDRVILGLRPEHVYPHRSRWATRPHRSVTVAATVEAVEPVGDQQYLSVRVGDDRLTSRCEPDLSFQPGETLDMLLDLDSALLFHPASGRRLSP
ncbi:ABC transporter ATP-binding protein [Fontimonas sp. SYSU GA230001]|uniref:ABC transporter ATP-binding protein n=1 Tax=Fontimonas sp. SYSU GA230001 TaxID=3142450 RepID=UPI0032B4409B